eukprot:PhF_6_TR39903/c0_g1_i1/m.59309
MVQYRLTSQHNLAISSRKKAIDVYPDPAHQKYRDVMLYERGIELYMREKLRRKMTRLFVGNVIGYLQVYAISTVVTLAGLTYFVKNIVPFDVWIDVQYLMLGDNCDRRAMRTVKGWVEKKTGPGWENFAGACAIMLSVEVIRAPLMFWYFWGRKRYKILHMKQVDRSMWRHHSPEE